MNNRLIQYRGEVSTVSGSPINVLTLPPQVLTMWADEGIRNEGKHNSHWELTGGMHSEILLEQSGLGTEVELEVENDRIVIRPVSRPREGWGEIFRLAQSEDDQKELP